MILQELYRAASLLGIVSVANAFIAETLVEFTSTMLVASLLFIVLEVSSYAVTGLIEIWRYFSHKHSASP